MAPPRGVRRGAAAPARPDPRRRPGVEVRQRPTAARLRRATRSTTACSGCVFEPNDERALGPRPRPGRGVPDHPVARRSPRRHQPEDAFFVKVDRTTMTQDDIDNGRLVVLVGIAPLRPAEFVIFRIGLWTAGSTMTTDARPAARRPRPRPASCAPTSSPATSGSSAPTCSAELAPWVENYWSLRWDLPPGTSYLSSTLPHPACNLSVERGHQRDERRRRPRRGHRRRHAALRRRPSATRAGCTPRSSAPAASPPSPACHARDAARRHRPGERGLRPRDHRRPPRARPRRRPTRAARTSTPCSAAWPRPRPTTTCCSSTSSPRCSTTARCSRVAAGRGAVRRRHPHAAAALRALRRRHPQVGALALPDARRGHRPRRRVRRLAGRPRREVRLVRPGPLHPRVHRPGRRTPGTYQRRDPSD